MRHNIWRDMFLGALFLLALLDAPSSLRAQGAARRPDLVKAYGELPLSFEVNQGQTARQVRFLSRGPGYTLFLTGNEAVLSLQGGRKPGVRRLQNGRQPSVVPRRSQRAAGVVQMRLVGANPRANVVGLGKLPGKANYFIGKNPKNWRTNVPSYAKVKYEDIYPGIDLVYYGNQGRLEFDFVVRPGANPNAIRLAVGPASRLTRQSRQAGATLDVAPSGDAVIPIEAGKLRFDKPVVYQETKAGARLYLVGSYALEKNGEMAFAVRKYDPRLPLVIDPVLAYSTYLGGAGYDGGDSVAVAVDSAGDAYITSATMSPNFPVTAGAYQTTYQGAPTTCNLASGKDCGDAFVTELNPTGTAVIYSTYLGGSEGNAGYGVAVNAAGNAYVTGYTDSSDFPTTPGAYQTTFGGSYSGCETAGANRYCGDVFVTELSPDGSSLVYSTYLGGSGDDSSQGIVLDLSGNAYVTGQTNSLNFPTTPGAFQTAFPGGNECASTSYTDVCSEAFVTKINPTGTALVYSTFLGGQPPSNALGIALDSADEAYVVANARAGFPTTATALQPNPPATGSRHATLSKLSADGASLLYSTYLGGSDNELGVGVFVDATGAAYVSGNTTSPDFPVTPGAYQVTYGGGGDAFVAKFDPSQSGASSLLFSTFLGGSGGEIGTGIAVDTAGNVYVDGVTKSPNFPIVSPLQTSLADSSGDAFVAELNPSGSKLLFSTYLGGSGFDLADFLALDPAGNVYVGGYTRSTGFPTTPGAYQTSYGGGAQDVFASKITFYSAEIQPPISPDGSSVFTANRGVVPVKFTLSMNGEATCALPSATISLTETSGAAPGPVNQSSYTMPADTGSDFRIDTTGCQYVYNLDLSSLGPGTYLAQINIDGTAVGSAEFGLQ